MCKVYLSLLLTSDGCKDIVLISLNYKDFTIIYIGSIGLMFDCVIYLWELCYFEHVAKILCVT